MRILLIVNVIYTSTPAITNSYRHQNGKAPLHESSELQKLAEYEVNQMCAISRLVHSTQVENKSLNYNGNVSQNAAKSVHADIHEIFKHWMDSGIHRENILGDWDETATACCKDRDGYFYMVQLFGKCHQKLDKNEATGKNDDINKNVHSSNNDQGNFNSNKDTIEIDYKNDFLQENSNNEIEINRPINQQSIEPINSKSNDQVKHKFKFIVDWNKFQNIFEKNLKSRNSLYAKNEKNSGEETENQERNELVEKKNKSTSEHNIDEKRSTCDSYVTSQMNKNQDSKSNESANLSINGNNSNPYDNMITTQKNNSQTENKTITNPKTSSTKNENFEINDHPLLFSTLLLQNNMLKSSILNQMRIIDILIDRQENMRNVDIIGNLNTKNGENQQKDISVGNQQNSSNTNSQVNITSSTSKQQNNDQTKTDENNSKDPNYKKEAIASTSKNNPSLSESDKEIKDSKQINDKTISKSKKEQNKYSNDSESDNNKHQEHSIVDLLEEIENLEKDLEKDVKTIKQNQETKKQSNDCNDTNSNNSNNEHSNTSSKELKDDVKSIFEQLKGLNETIKSDGSSEFTKSNQTNQKAAESRKRAKNSGSSQHIVDVVNKSTANNLQKNDKQDSDNYKDLLNTLEETKNSTNDSELITLLKTALNDPASVQTAAQSIVKNASDNSDHSSNGSADDSTGHNDQEKSSAGESRINADGPAWTVDNNSSGFDPVLDSNRSITNSNKSSHNTTSSEKFNYSAQELINVLDSAKTTSDYNRLLDLLQLSTDPNNSTGSINSTDNINNNNNAQTNQTVNTTSTKTKDSAPTQSSNTQIISQSDTADNKQKDAIDSESRNRKKQSESTANDTNNTNTININNTNTNNRNSQITQSDINQFLKVLHAHTVRNNQLPSIKRYNPFNLNISSPTTSIARLCRMLKDMPSFYDVCVRNERRVRESVDNEEFNTDKKQSHNQDSNTDDINKNESISNLKEKPNQARNKEIQINSHSDHTASNNTNNKKDNESMNEFNNQSVEIGIPLYYGLG